MNGHQDHEDYLAEGDLVLGCLIGVAVGLAAATLVWLIRGPRR